MDLTYGRELGGNTNILAWVDANYGICPDMRHSVSGGAVMIGKVAICWLSRIQNVTVAAESEYVMLSEIVNELRF